MSSPGQKLVLFTEHRDTLTYLYERIGTLLGREGSVVVIHGGVGREKRLEIQQAFQYDPEVQVLLATDAAGEGINLQRAHLMVNYDLPWNPNRLEQRFGRIHRIGQREVCHLWNLVAQDTREGDVYRRLLEKLEQAREALGGQVFNVLGKLEFEGRPLRDLLLGRSATGSSRRCGRGSTPPLTMPSTTPRSRSCWRSVSWRRLRWTLRGVQRVREDMERAEARRLQPHYIKSFFQEAFKRLGGKLWLREPGRFELTNVPATIRRRDRIIGTGSPVLPRYERVVFEKQLVSPPGQPLADFVCPGHPLLDAVIDLTLERHRDLLRRGAVLVDERDHGTEPRVLFSIEHALQDGNTTRGGERQVISKRVLYVELNADGVARHLHYAPYLDYRPLADGEPTVDELLDRPECGWIDRGLEEKAQAYAVANVVPEHLKEVRSARLELLAKTEAAVKERLTKEINHWDHRARPTQVGRRSREDGRPPQFGRSAAAGRHAAGPPPEAVRGTQAGPADLSAPTAGARRPPRCPPGPGRCR